MKTPWHAHVVEFMKEFPFITSAIVLVLLTLAAIAIFVPGGWFWTLIAIGIIVALVVIVGVVYEFEEKM
jgi:uncharacterized membrane protein